MSLKNHPNFHAVKFASDIMKSYFECLRGYGREVDIDTRDMIINFVSQVEEKIDKAVDQFVDPPRCEKRDTAGKQCIHVTSHPYPHEYE